ncbi:MAG: hypothetical protein K2P78_03445 [Gemmataceae bacterium]|nr:hypothetical protein [Gemmataceae bacterium]
MPNHTRLPLAAAVLASAALVGCQTGTPTILGYQAGADALYDPCYNTIYVPVFVNRAFQTTPNRGIEAEITRAVVREIGAKTRMRVVSDPDKADTELIGVVVAINKQALNRNQQNTIREAEDVVVIDVLWRDLRTGKNLSAPRRPVDPATGIPVVIPADPVPFDPNVPPPPPAVEPPNDLPTRIVAAGRFIPELGESNASARQRVANQAATQIVSMMERKW